MWSLVMILIPGLTGAQDVPHQTIRGKVVDQVTQEPLQGAHVFLIHPDTTQISSTSLEGKFKFGQVPVGTYTLRVSYMGYKGKIIENQRLSAGSEMVLQIELEESVVSLKNVEVTPEYRKDRPKNEMALASARSFTLEETNKYAGSYGDPARMASNFAGVLAARDNRNDIIIRGNSPIGLSWKIDEIEIPNPNHFGATGTTGGPITVINSNLLTNSDFLTGAFPAQYGNTLAGVFDLKLRTGNNQKNENWAQIGWNGLEFGTEGPFSKSNAASYLLGYRYSITDIIEQMGIKLEESAYYQDLNFKIHLPATSWGSFSLMGIGGLSNIKIYDSNKKPEEWIFQSHGEDLENSADLGILGVNHRLVLDDNSSLQTTLAVIGSGVETRIDTFSRPHPEPFTWAGEKTSEVKFSLSSELKSKINARSTFNGGLVFNSYLVNYSDSTYTQKHYQKDAYVQDKRINMGRVYGAYKHKLTSRLSGYAGLHAQWLMMNNSFSLEPRLGLEFDFLPGHSMDYGFGIHSQMQPKMMYFVRTPTDSSHYAYTNKNLDFSKSMHNVLGYQFMINENLRLKFELYHQYLYDIPVKKTQPAYSLLNSGAEFFVERQDSLVNQGTGQNYGIDITFEKFFSNSYYFLITGSLFQSTYKGYDGKRRNTAFNGEFALNVLAGYKWSFTNRPFAMNFGINLTWAGGRPYLPYDREKTVRTGEVCYNWDEAYSVSRNDYRRLSFRLGFERNWDNVSMESAIDFQYRSNYTNVYLKRIDVNTGEIVDTREMGFYPMATWKLQF